MSQFRIVSLLPAATELVYELGLGDQIVGRSHECDYPQTARFLPVCSEPTYDVSGNAGQIHQSAVSAFREALTMFTVNLELLKSLKPTHIITQTQCDICAVSKDELELKTNDLFNYQVGLLDFSPDSLWKYLDEIILLSKRLNIEEMGQVFVRNIQKRIFRIQHKTAKIISKPAVAILEWMEPLIPAGHWNRDFLEIANAENAFSNLSGPVRFDQLIQSDPDILIISPCGYPLKKTITDLTLLESRPGWNELSAVKTGKVYLCDGNHLFNRPGSRLIDTLEVIAEIVHPSIFPARHRDRHYLPYASLSDNWRSESPERLNHNKSENFIPDRDFYINSNGKYVFTSYYLLNRGYCCKNACLHCPYGYTGPPKQL